MGNVGAHADHVHIQFPEKFDVVHQIIDALMRQTDHHAGPHLIAHFAELPE